MQSRKHLIPVLLTASIAFGTAALADDSDSDSENAGPVTWSCQGERESVDPSKPDYGEKLSGLFRADIFPDGYCEAIFSASLAYLLASVFIPSQAIRKAFEAVIPL